MRIAQIAPLAERIPPKLYGGTERVVYALTEELVRRGHEVTLFASGDSITSAKLSAVYPRAIREAKVREPVFWELFSIGTAYDRQDEFDIIHDHQGYYSLAAANIARTPSIFTWHGPVLPQHRAALRRLRRPYIVSISQAQIRRREDVNYLGNVYNGLPMDHYPFSEENDGYLLFVGRISMEKGTHLAIEAAQQLNLPLVIAAKLDRADVTYFNEYVGPRLSDTSGQIKWIGEVDEVKRNELMNRALCLVHAITWNEPFGLTMIEAMACGCPVVAFNRGSVPEVVKNGETGFVAEDMDDLLDSILRVPTLSRAKCRSYALEKFSAKNMADGYEAIYEKMLEIENTSKQ